MPTAAGSLGSTACARAQGCDSTRAAAGHRSPRRRAVCGREQTLQYTVGVGKQPATPVAAVSQQEVVVAESSRTTAELPAAQAQAQPPINSDNQAMHRAWELLGLRLESLTDAEKLEVSGRAYPGPKGPVRYNGGLRVVSVRPNSVASRFIRAGDILLGLDGFETLGAANLSYILGDARIRTMSSLKCQIYRQGTNPLEGMLSLDRNP